LGDDDRLLLLLRIVGRLAVCCLSVRWLSIGLSIGLSVAGRWVGIAHDDGGSIAVIFVHSIDAGLFSQCLALSLPLAVADDSNDNDEGNDSSNNTTGDSSNIGGIVVIPALSVVVRGRGVPFWAAAIVVAAVIVAVVVVATHFIKRL